MQFERSTFKSVLFTSAVIGILQSILWICANLAAILTFRGVLHVPQYGTVSEIIIAVVKLYFRDEESDKPPWYPEIDRKDLTNPFDVHTWNIAYVIFSMLQLIFSLAMLRGRNAGAVRLKMILQLWCAVTVVICIMDAVLTGNFVSDYVLLKDRCREQSDKLDISASAAVMFVLSARGFVLWLINAGQVVYILTWLISTRGMWDSGMAPPSESDWGENGIDDKKSQFRKLNRKRNNKGEAKGYDNLNFTNSDEFHGTSGKMSYPYQETIYPENSMEAVTSFDGSTASRIAGALPGSRPFYYGDGWHALKCELENKLNAQNSLQLRPKPKKLTDFSHDIKNFKRGEGQYAYPTKGEIPKAPPLPSAVTCSDSSFY